MYRRTTHWYRRREIVPPHPTSTPRRGTLLIVSHRMKPTIETLEGNIWPAPEFDSLLVRTAHALRKKPLDELTPDDLRIAFNQNVGADFLKQRVLEVLELEPTTGDLFAGDLLLAVMNSHQFKTDADFRSKIIACAERALPDFSDADTRDEIRRNFG